MEEGDEEEDEEEGAVDEKIESSFLVPLLWDFMGSYGMITLSRWHAMSLSSFG